MSSEIAQKIRQHGADTYPHECCGALLAATPPSGWDLPAGGAQMPLREILALFPLETREDSPHNRFSVTAEDVREARSGRGQKLDVVGWYHSHPDHPARPTSMTGARLAWYSYVIVKRGRRRATEMTSCAKR